MTSKNFNYNVYDIYPAIAVTECDNCEVDNSQTIELTEEEFNEIEKAEKEWDKWQSFLHKKIYGY